MTMMEIIAIIATGVLCVLCVICIVALLSSKRQAKENKKAIQDIENSLGTVGDSIKEKTDQLIERLDRQQSDEDNMHRLELLEEEIRQLAGYEIETAGEENDSRQWEIEEIDDLDDEIELDDLFRELEAMPEQKQEELQTQPEPPQMPEPIPAPMPVQPTPVPVQPAPTPAQPAPAPVSPEPTPQPAVEVRRETRYHQGYNIGRSGRKYTAEELNVLIRE